MRQSYYWGITPLMVSILRGLRTGQSLDDVTRAKRGTHYGAALRHLIERDMIDPTGKLTFYGRSVLVHLHFADEYDGSLHSQAQPINCDRRP